MNTSKLLRTILIPLLLLPALATTAPTPPKPWTLQDLPVWDAGVRGGIPEVEVKKRFATRELSDADDTARLIQSAIDTVQTPGAVLLPEGHFTLKTAIQLRSGVVLRGQGIGKTKLTFELNKEPIDYPRERPAGGSIMFEGTHEEIGHPVNGDHLKGDTMIRISGLEHIQVGDMVELFSENDPHVLYTESRWKRPWAEQAWAQFFTVTQVSDEGIHLDTPLRLHHFKELNPRIRKVYPIEFAGLESMSIERVDDYEDASVGFEKARNCWVRGVESHMTKRGHVWINRGRFITVEANEVHHAFGYGGGGSGYGLVAGNVAVDCLFINNIAHNLRHSFMAKKGSNGNVFVFNYSFDRRRDPPGDSLLCDISLHGHYPYQNLFEGNVVEFVDIADHWGPTGPDTTFFRNLIRERIAIRDYSDHMRIIGNTIIEGGIDPDSTIQFLSLLDNLQLSKADPSDGSSLPASIYFKEKPDFWGDLPWPSIGPGTDPNRKVFIPAQRRRMN